MVWYIIKIILCLPLYSTFALENTTATVTAVTFNPGYLANYSGYIQHFMIERFKDTVPPLEELIYCDCPRVYIPVCASNNQSFTNVCKMNCINSRLRLWDTDRELVVEYRGLCWSIFDPYEY